ncbi:type IV toxin-antitoxin system AbiEi family antitoxin domain-containing protein [Myceligenerans crystallogenes]|uniref:AbiEi antitoxin N-terminal domain-containing protein n=1 Tax=Myceligenerans crystallogenes TaxID=316335 RepID=A0ABN2NIV8_9MICO
MSSATPRSTIATLAAGQWGLFSAAQATSLGVTRMTLSRIVSSGELVRVVHGVYATPSAVMDARVDTRAAWLATDPSRTTDQRLAQPHLSGVISHASAAALHQIGNILDSRVDITFPGRHQSRRIEVQLHRAELRRDDVTHIDGLPVTTPERTLADLVVAGHDREHISQALADAVDQHLTSPERVRSALARQIGDAAADGVMDDLLPWAGLDQESLVERLFTSAVVQRAFADAFALGVERFSKAVNSNDDPLGQEMTDRRQRSSMDAATVARTLASPAVRDLVVNLVFKPTKDLTDDSLRRALQTMQIA